MILFDEHGRRVPPPMAALAHATSRRYFKVNQPAIDYADIHARLQKHLGVEMSMGDFEARAEDILHRLREDDSQEILAGVKVPFILPLDPYASRGDYGNALESLYLPAVKDAFAEECPHYTFIDYTKDLAGKLSVEPESRHQRLVAAMGEQEMVGFYFPCLLEYSVPAALEQLAELPNDFMLSGGFDTSAAFVSAPHLIDRHDGYPPLLWLAALRGEAPGIGYHYEAYGHNLTFNRRPHLGRVSEYWAAGLTVIG